MRKFLAAISIATSVITMIFWSFGFLTNGYSWSCFGQALGSKRLWNEIIQVFIRNLILAVLIGLINNFFQRSNFIFNYENFFLLLRRNF